MTSRYRRPGIRVLKILAGFELAWLLLGNLFLSTELASMVINQKPDKFSISWDRAWTLYPVRVHATGLVVNQRSRTTRVQVRVEQASASIRLLPLVARHLVVDRIRGDTASVTLTRDVPPGEGPAPSKTTPGFLIELRDMNIENLERFSFNEIIVDGGQARASGSVGIRIRGDVSIEDIDARWQEADIRLGEAVLADSLS